VSDFNSEDLEKSLYSEIQHYLAARLGGVQHALEQLQDEVQEALARVAGKLQNDGDDESSPLLAAVAEHIRTAHQRGSEQFAAAARAVRKQELRDVALLKAAVDELNQQQTHAEILNTLVAHAASFAPRVCLFIIRKQNALGWRARGFDESIEDEAARQLSIPLSDNTPFRKVAISNSAWSGATEDQPDVQQFAARFGGEMPQQVVAVPLVAREKTVAILYADSGASTPESVNLEALEMLMRVAGMAVELRAKSSRSAAQTSAAQTAQRAPVAAPSAGSAASQAASPSAPPAAHSEAHDETAPADSAHSEVAASHEAPASAPASESAAPSYEPAFSGVASQQAAEAHAANSSASPAMDAHSFTPTPLTPAPQTSPLGGRRYGADIELPIQVSEDERRFHTDARRFARLLVSEIKLYNEQKVKDGRETGDIYERLRDEIDRSRQMYDKRVSPQVAARYDYFHHELVNTLAEGNPSKLGSDYPGAQTAS
jgi:hypothetical protein